MMRRLVILAVVFEIIFGFSGLIHAQEYSEDSLEIQRIELSLPDIRDLPIEGIRNFLVTTPNVVEVQSIPGNLLRIEAKGQGSTFLHIWDSRGRRTYEIRVIGFNPDLNLNSIRRGFNPHGPQFSYQLQVFNNASSGQGWDDVIYEHEFQAYLPIRSNKEWKTILRAVTNPRILEGTSGAPFSQATEPTYMLSYYRTSHWTLAAGDASFNNGELSISGFPFRGGLLKFQKDREQVQVFGGWTRPDFGQGNYLSTGKPQVYGYSATKKLIPNLYFTNSFVFLNQEGLVDFSGDIFKNDYVYTLGLLATPLKDKWTLEAEYGRNREDQAFRGLVEYLPYWGRLFGSYKRIGTHYVNLSEGFLLDDYQEGNFIAEFQPHRKLDFTLNYLFYQLGLDKNSTENANSKNHSIYLTSRWTPTPNTSYLSAASFSKSDGKLSNLQTEAGSTTYQHYFHNRKNNLYARAGVEHRVEKSSINASSLKELRGEVEGRYNWLMTDKLELNFREDIDIRNINQQGLFNTRYTVAEFNSGAGANYNLRHTYIGGGVNHFISVGSPKNTHNIQPYFSVIFKPNQALSLETQGHFNYELKQRRYFVDLTGQITYRFGSGIPDTLFSGFKREAKVFGKVYLDVDHDGVYGPQDQVLSDLSLQLDHESPVSLSGGSFSLKTQAGSHQLTLIIPEKYKNLKINNANPYGFQIGEAENREINFGLYEGSTLVGSLFSDLNQDGKAEEDEPGVPGVKIKIKSENYEKILIMNSSSHFNLNVPKLGHYTAEILPESLPIGYQIQGPSQVDAQVAYNEIGKLPPLSVRPLTSFSGRAFFDKNSDGIYNDGDEALRGIKIKLGDYTTESESDGTFLIQNIIPNFYPLVISPLQIKGLKTSPPASINISPDSPMQSLNLIYNR